MCAGPGVRITPLAVLMLGFVSLIGGGGFKPSDMGDSPHRDILVHLANCKASAVPATVLADSLDYDVIDLWDDVLDAERDGAVETWADHPVEPTVGLSTLTAARLGLSLSADGTVWLAGGEKDLTSVTPRSWATGSRMVGSGDDEINA